MPYVTQIPNAVLSVPASEQIVTLPTTQLVNAFGPSVEFQQYDVDATGATTLVQGHAMSAVDLLGNPLIEGSYLGSGTLNNAVVGLNLGITNLSLQVNPLPGHFMLSPPSQIYMITDQPLTEDFLSVTATATVFGPSVTVTAPMSTIAGDLASAVGGAIGGVINSAAVLIQTTLNTAIITLDFDPDGALVLDALDVVPCFTRGTLIRTAEGLVPVEDLVVGDLVETRDHGPQPIRWRGIAKLGPAALAKTPSLRPIRISAGALGEHLPAHDLVVSPQHRVLVRSRIAQRMFGTSEVLVAAKQLLDLPGIEIDERMTDVEYIHLMFDRHEIVESNGAETESLYAGPMALKAVGAAARTEIFRLFPELATADHLPPSARIIPAGSQARRLARRHACNSKVLVAPLLA